MIDLDNKKEKNVSKKLNLSFGKYWNKYRESIDDETEDEFINNFIDSHVQDGVESKDDFYSIALRSAVLDEDIDVINHILEHEFKRNIFADYDTNSISNASLLYWIIRSKSEEIDSIFSEYFLESFPQQNLDKVFLNDEHSFNSLYYAIHSSPLEHSREELVRKYLSVVLGEEQVEEMTSKFS